MRQSLCIVRDRRFGQNVHCYVPFFLMFRTPYKLCFQKPNKFPKAWQMPVCCCIVILTIAMIRKMVIVMINMMVITYRPLVGWRPQHNLYVDASFREMFIITGSPAPLQGIAVLCWGDKQKRGSFQSDQRMCNAFFGHFGSFKGGSLLKPSTEEYGQHLPKKTWTRMMHLQIVFVPDGSILHHFGNNFKIQRIWNSKKNQGHKQDGAGRPSLWDCPV